MTEKLLLSAFVVNFKSDKTLPDLRLLSTLILLTKLVSTTTSSVDHHTVWRSTDGVVYQTSLINRVNNDNGRK